MGLHTFTATDPETGYVVGTAGNVWADVWGHAGIGGFEAQYYHEAYCRIVSSEYRLSRGRIRFDTSDTVGTASSATLRLAFYRIVHNNGANYLHIVGAVGCGDDMAGSDFATLKDNATDICSPILVSDIVVDTYIERALNSTGLALISATGYTIIGLRLDDDISNTAPVDGVKEVWLSWYGGVHEPTPTGYEAKLVVNDSSTLTDDRVTGIVIREGPGYYTNELHLGGLSTSWRLVDLQRRPTPAVPSEYAEPTAGPQVWSGPFWYEPDLNLIPPADRARAAAEGGYWFWIVDGQLTRTPPAEYWEYFR